ncbi:MAG: hypothetical protein Q8S73_43765 [Deltaproteobacteria bacterium]|nr:hypothetical protein [Myxococcales bacterium]MDP3221081.1 hypothetical protein [Deltaproteobacteria bacterium]
MKTRAFLFAVGLVLAALPAAAQDVSDPPAPSSGWTVHPSERHILVRTQFGIGARLRDPFSYGVLSPPSVLVQGTYAFLHLGKFLLGPSLGLQGGIDGNGAQIAVQPGVQIYRRFTDVIAAHARVDVPLLITRGACQRSPGLMVPAGSPQWVGSGIAANRGVVYPPGWGYCPELSVGFEVAAGAAFYVRSGLAVTAEAIFDLYLGNGGSIYPIIGGGVGILVDYEVLP